MVDKTKTRIFVDDLFFCWLRDKNISLVYVLGHCEFIVVPERRKMSKKLGGWK